MQTNSAIFTRSIKNEDDYDQVSRRIAQLMNACKGSPEADELDT